MPISVINVVQPLPSQLRLNYTYYTSSTVRRFVKSFRCSTSPCWEWSNVAIRFPFKFFNQLSGEFLVFFPVYRCKPPSADYFNPFVSLYFESDIIPPIKER